MPLEYACIVPHGGDIIPQLAVRRTERLFEKTRESVRRIARDIPLRQNIAFGIAIAEIAEKSKNRIVFIASADQAHAHTKSGPYGYHRSAVKYDEFVSLAIQGNRIESIFRLSKRFVEEAKPDSLWQMAMLAGITKVVGMQGNLLSYAVPTYYGMICASFVRA